MGMEVRSVFADSGSVALREVQERTVGKLQALLWLGIKQFLPSRVIFFSNAHLAALVQERRKEVAGFTQGWDIFRASGIGQRDEEEECVHENNCEGG